ncbi:MAG: hypothetical protein ACTSU5_19175 [Promethearchaeota archaeon]
MPWTNDRLRTLVGQTQQLLVREFRVNVTAEVLLCTREEMIRRFTREVEARASTENWPPEHLENWKEFLIPMVEGKYFGDTDEVWLVAGVGDTRPTLIHELLHSIQECHPKREPIVQFLTYRLTRDASTINGDLRGEWEEIERQTGLSGIKERLLKPGDCEDF